MVKLTQATKPVKEKDVERNWHLVDVSGKILGRAIPEIARFLQGKHKVNYVSNIDTGDYVVVINAKKIVLSGRKSNTKVYTRYSGYPGGLRTESFSNLINKKPQAVIKHAVLGMLPKNKLRDRRMTRLFVFADDKHPYQDKIKNNISEVKITSQK